MTGEPPPRDAALTASLSEWETDRSRRLTEIRRIGRYQIIEPLGEGTSKRVFLARDELLEREVALAVITDTAVRGPLHTRLLREARTAARLGDHPHIVTLHDVAERDGITFLVSQLVRGGSVADRLRDGAPAGLPLPDALRIASEVADALAHAHGQGVVHRDVKPSNILLGEDGAAMLTDFGVALLTDRSRVTTEGAVIGSAAYMSPEQAQGQPLDMRGDLYSLGATLYEMVCGRPMFEGDVLAVISQHVRRQPPDPRAVNSAVPDGLAALILRLVSKRPEDRPGSAREVERALAELLSGWSAANGAGPSAALPPQLAGPAERPFVGRDQVIESLMAGWLRAGEGGPSLRLVIGDPGMGKTRVAAAFARRVGDDGALVLYGRCDEELLISYQPFVEALRQLISHYPGLDAAVDPRLEPELRELGRLVPELRGNAAPPDSAADTRGSERYLLFETVVALFAAGAAKRPLLLVLDDLHWADKPTVLLLRHLLRVSDANAMVLATTRPDGLDAEQPLSGLIADVHRDGDSTRLERVALDGLDEAETGSLVSSREAGAIDDEFVSLLHEETAGNPFFIEESLRALRGADLSTAAGAASALRSVGVPEGAKEVIQRRLARLSPEVVELLRSASVCGREFRLGVVAELMGVPVARLLGPLDEAMAAGLVVEPIVDSFSFCHWLVREALYAGIASDTHRARLHLAAGEALEKLGDGVAPSELALHFHAARAVGGAQKAARYADAAAEAALSALAYEEAAGHTARELDALEVLGPDRGEERGRLLHALGRLQWQAGDRAAAQATFLREAQLARELGHPDQLARSALGYGGRYYDAEHVDAVLIGLLEEALGALPPGDDPVRAEVMGRLADALHFTEPEGRALTLSADAVSMGRRTSSRTALLAVLGARHTVLLNASHLEERLKLSHEWLALAQDAAHYDEEALALNWRIYDLLESGDGDAARETHRQLVELADRLRQPHYLNFAATWEFNWLLMAGRFAEAEAKAVESYRYARRAQVTYGQSLFAGQLFALRHDQGRLGEIVAVIAPLVGENPTLSAWRAAMPMVRAAAGDHERAGSELSALSRDDFAAIPFDDFWLCAMCLLAESCAALAEAAGALGLIRRLEPYAELNAQVGLAFCLGPVRRFLGLMHGLRGDFDRAGHDFAAAIERSARIGAVTIEAQARCEYGEMLLRAGREGARPQLEQAHSTAERLGMEGLMARAAQALQSACQG